LKIFEDSSQNQILPAFFILIEKDHLSSCQLAPKASLQTNEIDSSRKPCQKLEKFPRKLSAKIQSFMNNKNNGFEIERGEVETDLKAKQPTRGGEGSLFFMPCKFFITFLLRRAIYATNNLPPTPEATSRSSAKKP